jgi:hypothetical protein
MAMSRSTLSGRAAGRSPAVIVPRSGARVASHISIIGAGQFRRLICPSVVPASGNEAHRVSRNLVQCFACIVTVEYVKTAPQNVISSRDPVRGIQLVHGASIVIAVGNVPICRHIAHLLLALCTRALGDFFMVLCHFPESAFANQGLHFSPVVSAF